LVDGKIGNSTGTIHNSLPGEEVPDFAMYNGRKIFQIRFPQ